MSGGQGDGKVVGGGQRGSATEMPLTASVPFALTTCADGTDRVRPTEIGMLAATLLPSVSLAEKDSVSELLERW